MRTRKVLYIGIRNKYCSFCSFHGNKFPGKPIPKHKCYKNWSGSSTAMEADAIVEGFKISVSMHGLKYYALIGDGDSSVYRKILEARPYGRALIVIKLECRNHILRNFRGRLRKIVENSRVNMVKLKTFLFFQLTNNFFLSFVSYSLQVS